MVDLSGAEWRKNSYSGEWHSFLAGEFGQPQSGQIS
jgi:hypothetical protein